MKLNKKLCATHRKLSQHAGWTIDLDAVCSFCIVLLEPPAPERSEELPLA